ncbi:Type 1 glutamine amidotransferase-like domain-containing protein [Paramicrobacterium chengjingii]|uniref:Type 1 glutamine amidotransferase-like domain-containing protein n=1 Tax=Paramicrobacterium chengjingii TaxID=2769067 RepID=UPI00141D917E|nr:Type 1 glutamine amidotransferase-like domain-containing protein [Microbacterium chengjingii]
MSIYLSGGGEAPLLEFVADAARSSARRDAAVPRIALIYTGREYRKTRPDEIVDALTAAGECEPVVCEYDATHDAVLADLVDIDAVYVSGGDAREYLRVLQPIIGEIRRRVAEGTPYFGTSAGALIAADKALVAGHSIGGVPVSPPTISSNDSELEIAEGIGLVDITIDVHAAQWGTVSRLIAATEAGLVNGGVAIDENTALVVTDGGLTVVGSGSIWQVIPGEHGVNVATAAAS